MVIEFDRDDYVPRPKLTIVALLNYRSESRLTPLLSFSAFDEIVFGVAKLVMCFMTLNIF